jgi:hypothetical protein
MTDELPDLEGDEAPLGRPFWNLNSTAESDMVYSIIKRRFPAVYEALSMALERADPMEIVYPGNPHEYSDVVLEVIVLLAPVCGDLGRVTSAEMENLLREGLGRIFGEPPDEERLRHAATMLFEDTYDP